MPRPSALALLAILAAALQARSRVHSLEALKNETTLRAGLAGLRFTQEDLDDIVAYLDQSHYRFSR